MTAPPTFASQEEHVTRIGDVNFWRPYVSEILKKHGLAESGGDLVAGYNPTYPTFLVGEVVVKLFGYSQAWRGSYTAERSAHLLIAKDSEIKAPRVLAEGDLYEKGDAPWPYLVTSRMAGRSWREAEPSPRERLTLAAELGRLIRRVHALNPVGVATHSDGSAPDLSAAAERSSLPPHLVAQVAPYVSRLGPFDSVFVHGDLTATHVFVDHGRLSGVIDWGDAMATDRHYELIQVHRDLFDCDKNLLRVFLEAADWPAGRDFCHRALGLALHRQAVGLAQHHSMDVFEPVAARLPLADIGTLDELATELFAM